jgi:hypothetical protein
MAQTGQAIESVTLAHIRGHSCRDLLVYCESIDCNHGSVMNADQPIRSLGPRMVCARCGHRGADVRPDWRALTNKPYV